MRLALCLFKYFPYGGLQRNFLAIASELKERGHDVIVYTASWEGEQVNDFTVELIDVHGMTNHGRNKSFYFQLASRLKERQQNNAAVDLVIGFNKMPGLDIYYCADTCFATKAYEQKKLLYRLTSRCRWSLACERAVFECSANTEILLLSANEGIAYQKYYSTPEERLHLMPPGISRNRIRNSISIGVGNSIRQQLGVSADEKLLAFLGSDYKRKGLDRLLAAVASLPDVQRSLTKVLVIGRDKRMQDYQRLAERLNIQTNIIFVGQRDDVPALLFACNYLVHPAYSENTGNAILEGVVAGLPVLCTAVCGYAFYIHDHGLGGVVPEPFEQTIMNNMLKRLLDNAEQERMRCLAFAETADIYSRPQRIAETIEQIGARKCQ